MIGNSGKLPGVSGAGEANSGKLSSTQNRELGFSPKNTGDISVLHEGMAPQNLLGGRKVDKTGAMNQISRKNLVVNG